MQDFANEKGLNIDLALVLKKQKKPRVPIFRKDKLLERKQGLKLKFRHKFKSRAKQVRSKPKDFLVPKKHMELRIFYNIQNAPDNFGNLKKK